MKSNRKSATGLYLVNWSRFSNVEIKLEGSTLITGVNGTGKSTVLDAITYLLTGNTHFNIAAKDKDRSVTAYVRGDTHSDGDSRYLRDQDEVVSYIAMEFWAPEDNSYFVAFVCIEYKKDSSKTESNWYIAKNARFSDINFCEIADGKQYVNPKSLLKIKGTKVFNKDFYGMERGTKQVLQALGLRCTVAQYKSKLIKMMSFDPQKNIDRFIQECVLEPGEMSSLASLKEQRDNYEEIKNTYEDMQTSKVLLEKIEAGTIDYEQKRVEYLKRKLMLSYQNWQQVIEEEGELEQKKRSVEASLDSYQASLKKIEEDRKKAQKRLEDAENNTDYQSIKAIIDQREAEIESIDEDIKTLEKEKAKLIRFINDAKKLIDRFSGQTGFDGIALDVLANLDNDNSVEKKMRAVSYFADYVKKIDDEKHQMKYDLSREIENIKVEMDALYKRKSSLESNKFVYDPGFVRTRDFIKDELRKRSIDTDVRFFVELISEVKDKRWRRAIETFLGNKRFNIIVDGKYCQTVLEILNENPAYKGKVVITDKLEETDVCVGSAAEQLVIANVYARQYANYLLNGIHLCETVAELHENPKGALMDNGMLAKSFASGKMKINDTVLFIGLDAIKLQLEETKKRITEEENHQKALEQEERTVQEDILVLESISLNAEEYNFSVSADLTSKKTRKNEIKAEINTYSNDAGFTAIFREREKAQQYLNSVEDEKAEVNEKIGAAKKEKETIGKEQERKVQEEESNRANFSEECKEAPELKQLAIDEYEDQRKKKQVAIKYKTVQDWKSSFDDAEKRLEDLHLEYCKLNNLDLEMRGPSFIGYFREIYRSLANVKMEEAKKKLAEQGERLQSAFVGDFVAEINEAIEKAKDEIDAINKELKTRPFGNDIYSFKMTERTDSKGKALFFKICAQMHKYIDNAELYLASVADDEEAEQDIHEFIDIVLNEEDETEYTDYRKYFNYDMKIESKQGMDTITGTLSNKQGSASNGEKQTPYFIILAASLLQLYPRGKSSSRLAFIDEAFSALSKERIEQMVDYLETNDFQVIYAAPPEKINSIGSHINTTVTLISKGRYSFAVEGLVKVSDE